MLSRFFGNSEGAKPAARNGHPVSLKTSERTQARNGEVSRSVKRESAGGLNDGAGANTVISSYDKVPAHTSVLTVDARMRFPVPKDMERSLLVLECGPNRAIVLYDPAYESRKMAQALRDLKAKIIGEGFKLDGEYPTKAGVLQQLYVDSVRRRGDEVGGRNQDVSEARKLFERWIEIAVAERATDIHIEVVASNRAVVRIRVDGELELIRDENGGQYSSSVAMDAMAWAYNLNSGKGSNNQSQFQQSENLYCMMEPRTVRGQLVALRYQSVRGWQGPKLICRLLNVDVNTPTLSYPQLGYERSQEHILQEVARMPAGFVLFAGVTGSGKTTTLKTFIETHPGNGSSAFYSIEDPVEYPLRGVHQIPLQRDLMNQAESAAKYAEVVGALMRGDPDGVLMGEIRDTATALAGQQIVETGHMACGTVHAHLLSGILPRLTNDEIGMSREVLTNPNMLSLLAYQALVPLLCQHCSLTGEEVLAQTKDDAERDHIVQILESTDKRFKLDAGQLRFKHVGGCEHCNGRGTRGLTVVAEMMIPDRKWLQLSRAGMDYEAVMHYRSASDRNFLSSNMDGKTVFEHALYKAMNQRIDPRQCERFDSFTRFEILQPQ